jgi:hypothetical protein
VSSKSIPRSNDFSGLENIFEYLPVYLKEGRSQVSTSPTEDLKALGLDNVATVFKRDVAEIIFKNIKSEDADWDKFDMDLAKTFALFTSIAYCSNTTTIKAWKCTR